MKKFFKAVKNVFVNYFKNNSIFVFLFFPVTLLYLELVFRIMSSKESFSAVSLAAAIFLSAATGIFLDLLCSVSRSRIFNTVLGAVFTEIFCLWATIEYFMQRAFSMYIDLSTIIAGTTGVATENGEGVASMVAREWYVVLVYHLPLIVYILFFAILRKLRFSRIKKQSLAFRAVVIIASLLIALIPSFSSENTRSRLTTRYDTDTCIKTYTLQSALILDFFYTVFGNPWLTDFDISETDPSDTSSYSSEYYNIINIDLSSINFDDEGEKITEYIDSVIPTEKNEYTGMFDGYNLIQITAESFTPYFVDEELTPILYKLSTEGIIFEEYYQPLWSGSTTTAEFQIMTGLIPFSGYNSMQETLDKNMYFSLGSLSKQYGYSTTAFHNGTYSYYNRYLTHVNMGYDEFIANGNGMTGLSNGSKGWPQSDLEMMEFIAPDYFEDQPFNLYIMTVSGHSTYSMSNKISAKNYDEVKEWADSKGYDYSTSVLCYIAANLELEKALEYLFEQLEEADLLDNTVIMLTGDHYPYSLTDKFQYDEDGNIIKTEIEENLSELFGSTPETLADYDRNALYIWSQSLSENEEKITVETPVSSVDILPTLANLFGWEYDSRMLAGRDALSENSQPLVIFSDYSWLTDAGYYDASTGTFTPSDPDGSEADDSYDDYIDEINRLVSNRVLLSKYILDCDYYGQVFGE